LVVVVVAAAAAAAAAAVWAWIDQSVGYIEVYTG